MTERLRCVRWFCERSLATCGRCAQPRVPVSTSQSPIDCTTPVLLHSATRRTGSGVPPYPHALSLVPSRARVRRRLNAPCSRPYVESSCEVPAPKSHHSQKRALLCLHTVCGDMPALDARCPRCVSKVAEPLPAPRYRKSPRTCQSDVASLG